MQNLYNLANRQSEAVLDHCEQNGIGFIPWYPLAGGPLAKEGGVLDTLAKKLGTTPSQISLAWVLKRSRVMLPIPGTGKVKHLGENTAAASLQARAAGRRALSMSPEEARVPPRFRGHPLTSGPLPLSACSAARW